MSFDRSSVVITGGNKGIGLSIAKVFSRNTERPIVLVARDKDDLEKAKQVCLEEGAAGVEVISTDLTHWDELKIIDIERFKPGILVNNAGSFLFKNLKDTSEEEVISQFKINALGAFNMTKLIRRCFENRDRALIVNICSMSSLEGLGDSGAYSMAKHATLGFSRSLRKELMGTNIAVSAINLGQTYSTSWHDVDIDPDKLIDPEDVGHLIVSLSKLSIRSIAEEISLMPSGGKVNPM